MHLYVTVLGGQTVYNDADLFMIFKIIFLVLDFRRSSFHVINDYDKSYLVLTAS